MLGIGMGELAVILLIGLLVFGPEKLPDLARSAGRALAMFNQTFERIQQEIDEGMQEVKEAANVNLEAEPAKKENNVQEKTQNQA